MQQTELILKIPPFPKPRMTQSDKWNRRECVVKYWQWAEELNTLITADQIPQPCHITFVMPIPAYWSKKRRMDVDNTPHCQRPDWDNLAKAFFDALYKEDSAINDVRVTKVWGQSGLIVIKEIL